jgi:hypothetical protein
MIEMLKMRHCLFVMMIALALIEMFVLGTTVGF